MSQIEREELVWRRFAYLSFAFVVLVVGLPIWWFTTTPYRAALPYIDSEYMHVLEEVSDDHCSNFFSPIKYVNLVYWLGPCHFNSNGNCPLTWSNWEFPSSCTSGKAFGLCKIRNNFLFWAFHKYMPLRGTCFIGISHYHNWCLKLCLLIIIL